MSCSPTISPQKYSRRNSVQIIVFWWISWSVNANGVKSKLYTQVLWNHLIINWCVVHFSIVYLPPLNNQKYTVIQTSFRFNQNSFNIFFFNVPEIPKVDRHFVFSNGNLQLLSHFCILPKTRYFSFVKVLALSEFFYKHWHLQHVLW